MSHQQPRRPGGDQPAESIKYGDVFPHVEGELALKPVTPDDAAVVQSAETVLLGKTLPGGAAAAIQSAAAKNVMAGFVGQGNDDNGDVVVADNVVSMTETEMSGKRDVTELVGGQDARSKLSSDRPATRRDAEGVAGAEMPKDPFLTTHPTGVAASIAAAARLKQNNK